MSTLGTSRLLFADFRSALPPELPELSSHQPKSLVTKLCACWERLLVFFLVKDRSCFLRSPWTGEGFDPGLGS